MLSRKTKAVIDLAMSSGKSARSSFFTQSPLSELMRVSWPAKGHQFIPHANMKDSVYEFHINVAGSPEELIQRFREAGPESTMLDGSTLDHIKEHIDHAQHMTPEQLEDRTYTYESPNKKYHLSSNISMFDVENAKDLAGNVESMKRFFGECFPGVVYFMTAEVGKEFFALKQEDREKWLKDNAQSLDLMTKEIMKDGKPLAGRYMALGTAIVGNGPHNTATHIDGTIAQMLYPFTTNQHTLGGVAVWSIVYSPKFPGKIILVSVHLGKNNVPFMDRANNYLAPRLKAIMGEMFAARVRAGLEVTWEAFVQKLEVERPRLFKTWNLVSAAQRLGNPYGISFQRKMGFVTDFEFRRINLPLNDSTAVQGFIEADFDQLLLEAAPADGHLGVSYHDYRIEAAGLFVPEDLDSLEFDADMKITEQQRAEFKKFVSDSVRLGMKKGLASLGSEYTNYLNAESRASAMDIESIKASVEVSTSLDKFVNEVYLKKFQQMQADAPDFLANAPPEKIMQWMDCEIRNEYILPLIMHDGALDDLYHVEREKIQYEIISKEYAQVKHELVELEQKVETTKRDIEERRVAMGKEFEKMTVDAKAKWDKEVKELKDMETKLKETKEKERGVERRVEQKGKEKTRVEKEREHPFERHMHGIHK